MEHDHQHHDEVSTKYTGRKFLGLSYCSNTDLFSDFLFLNSVFSEVWFGLGDTKTRSGLLKGGLGHNRTAQHWLERPTSLSGVIKLRQNSTKTGFVSCSVGPGAT